MSIADNMKNLTGNVKQGAKDASISIFQRVMRLITGFFIGVVLALIVQEFTKSSTLMLVFLVTLFMMIVYRSIRSFSILQIFIFQIFCILIGNSLRMYVMMAT